MGNIVNLHRAKKAKARAAAGEAAAANRARHGTPKPVHHLTKARSEKAAHDLEGLRLTPDRSAKD